MAYCEQYGDFCQFRLGNRPGVLISDQDIVMELMENKNFALRTYPPVFDLMLQGKGILFTNDMERWKIQRTAALHGIMKNSHLKLIAEWTNQATNNLLERLKTDHSSFELDVCEDLSKLTLDVIAKAAFSIETNSVLESSSVFTSVVENILAITEFAIVPPFVFKVFLPPKLRRVMESKQTLCEMVLSIIKQRRDSGQVGSQNDLLDILLKYQSEESSADLSDEDIVISCLDMFMAGHETTASKNFKFSIKFPHWLIFIRYSCMGNDFTSTTP